METCSLPTATRRASAEGRFGSLGSSIAGVLHWLPWNVGGWFHIQRHPQPLMHPISKPGLQPREGRQSMLLGSRDSSGAARVSPQLLSLADPSEQLQEGIRAKNEVTSHFWAGRSPPAQSLQQLLVHRCL